VAEPLRALMAEIEREAHILQPDVVSATIEDLNGRSARRWVCAAGPRGRVGAVAQVRGTIRASVRARIADAQAAQLLKR